MLRSAIFPTTLCTILLSASFFSGNSQNRSEAGKCFVQQPRPSTQSRQRSSENTTSLRLKYRSFDGTNNNISNGRQLDWGAADIPLYREMPAVYGSENLNNAMGGVSRPSPRQISNLLCDEPVTQFNSRKLSSFVYVWGQFLDHDMTLTPTDTTEYVPIQLPEDEVVFTGEIPFYRSEVRKGSGINSEREQTNLNTSWVDASQVYGSDKKRADWLRTFDRGKMKVSKGNLLPFNTTTGELSAPIDPTAPSMSNDNNKTVKTFVAGDIRAAEHPGISILHAIFVRLHNKICDRLIAHGLSDDEEIYQRARKEVGGIVEAITYNEFLPAIGITLQNYGGYKSNVRPDMMNTVATAGYRLGHTMVADDILLFDNDCNEVEPGEFDLVEVFWNPTLLLDHDPDAFMKGFAAHTQYETDTKINSVLRNFLFGSPNDTARFGIDLGSLNIQRGRDHGLPDYNTVRNFYTGRKAESFYDITTNKTIAKSLHQLYDNVDNIDLRVWLVFYIVAGYFRILCR
jgi:peroxidase